MFDDFFKEFGPTMIGSTISGVLSRIPTHPIDTCKARIQAHVQVGNVKSVYNSIFGTMKFIYHESGLRGLYRGFPLVFLAGGPASCLYFTSYELSKRGLHPLFDSIIPRRSTDSSLNLHDFCVNFTAGIIAETASCLIWVPIDVIKERMQVQALPLHTGNGSTVYYNNTISAVRTILRTEGIFGLYRGYGATILSFGPFSALYFVFYELFKAKAQLFVANGSEYQRKKNLKNSVPLPLYMQVIVASSAGAVSAILTNPLDLVRLRLQIQRYIRRDLSSKSAFHYSSTSDGVRQIASNEGYIAMFRGSSARILFHSLSTAISLTIFEYGKSLFERRKLFKSW